MTWHDLSGFSTFEKARRRELARRLSRLVLGRPSDRLLALDNVRDQLGLYEQWYVGIRSIPLSKIVGSVDRAADFDRAFLPKRGNMEGRWKRVEQAFRIEAFPPIVAFKVGDAYFVEDGHHRVAIARQRKDDFIDGDVTEVKSPVEITADTDIAEIVHMGLRQWFMRESQLDQVRPGAHIEPSRPHAYAELLDIIFAAGFELAMERQTLITPAQASAHWHDDLYVPSVEKIQAGNLPTIFPNATEADLYLRVHEQHRELVSRTAPHGIDDAVDSAELAAADTIKARTRLAIGDAKERITSPSKNGKEGRQS